jgi:hypothetical protein
MRSFHQNGMAYLAIYYLMTAIDFGNFIDFCIWKPRSMDKYKVLRTNISIRERTKGSENMCS